MKQVNYSDYSTVEDQRKEIKRGQAYGESEKNLYDSLINMVVNHKMELQKIPQCSSLAGAQAWAGKRGLRAGQQDFDGDKVNEIVVYNKAGQPMIINGYKPKPSDFAMRQRYWTENPTFANRIDAGPMKSWITEKAYSVVENPDNKWKRTVHKTEFGKQLKETGYRMPTRPKKQFSVFSIFSKLIAPFVNQYFTDPSCFQEGFGEGAYDNCVKVFKKILSPISLYRILYLILVERPYYFELLSKRKIPDPSQSNQSYDIFKEYVKSHQSEFWTFFKENYLTGANLNMFKENKINLGIVVRAFAKGRLNWNGNDPDDIIVFLFGEKNINQEFHELLLNEDSARAFLIRLSDKTDKTEYKKARKILEKMKANSREATKIFFDKYIKNFFMNENAFNNFNERVYSGQSFTAQTEDVAIPSSPPRTVENGDLQNEEPPEIPPPITQQEEQEEEENPNETDVNQY